MVLENINLAGESKICTPRQLKGRSLGRNIHGMHTDKMALPNISYTRGSSKRSSNEIRNFIF